MLNCFPGDGYLMSDQETHYVPLWGRLWFVLSDTFSSLWYFWYHCHIPIYSKCYLYLSLTTGDEPKFKSSIDPDTGVVALFVPDTVNTAGGHELLVCRKLWDMAAANVVCKENGNPL